MKIPEEKNVETDVGIENGPPTTRPPGGKVLQRLMLFEEERGLPTVLPEAMVPEEEVPKKKTKKSLAPEVEADGESDFLDYAQALIDATVSLGQKTGGEEMGTRDLGDMSPPTATGPNWRFLGPSSTPDGQTYGDTRVVVSGRVAAIAIDPSNSNHILCGAAGGGVWESQNRGAGWSPRTDYMPTLTTGALAFVPTSPNVVYCGTGEGNFYAGLGAGLLRSTNGGTTWAVHATSPFVGQGFYDLKVDPANGNHLLAATTGGFYESTNGGTAWTLRRSGTCWDIALNPAGGSTAEILAAFSNGIFKSVNGGATWIAETLPGAPASFNRLAVSIAKSSPAVAYAFGASGSTAYLYKRAASGSWSRVTTVPTDFATGQAWYDWFLGVSPDNPNQVYLGGIEVYRGTQSGTSWGWVKISNKVGDDIHPDQHALAFDPANADVIYVGNDGGLFTSPNRGMNWTSLNNGLGITEIEYLAQDYGSSRWLIAGTQDNGSVRYTGNQVWDHVADGDGGDCGVNRTDPNVVYHCYYNMGMERSITKGNFGSFSWIGPNVPTGYSNLFYPPMEVNNDTVAQAGQSVFASRNRGTNWTEIAIGTGQVASAMYIPDPDRIYVGTTRGRLFRITWLGSAWSVATELTSPRLNASISDIHVDPTNLNRIWVTFTSLNGGRVFRSDNGGTSWTDLSAGLPNLPISAVEVHPGNTNRIWVAADVGVYQSLNLGGTWSPFSNGLPNSLAVDLLYHPHARVLRVGMRNRGVWEIPVDGWPTSPYCATQFTGSLLANQTRKWFTFRWPATWHVVWTVMPTNISSGAPQVKWNVQVERADAEYVTYWIEVTNLKNIPLTFEGRYAILSYY